MNPLPAELRRRSGPRRSHWRAGNAAVEFALIAPLLITLFVATAEAVTYLRMWSRIEQAATSAAQAGSRVEVLDRNAVEGLFATAQVVADPYQAWTVTPSLIRARTVISVVSNPTSGNTVSWSCSRGDTTLTTRVAGAAGTLPASFTVPRGQSVLVVEIVNTSVPWLIMAAPIFFGTSGPPGVRAYTVVRPRSTELTNLTGGCP
jgi:Flp pilus assembly protein TadG